MSEGDETPRDLSADLRGAKRTYSQLLHLQDRVMMHLRLARSDLDAPTTAQLLKRVRAETGSPVGEQIAQVTQAIEAALRVVQLCQSELQKEFSGAPDVAPIEEIPNLPATLRRFLAERAEVPGFQYEVGDDPVRGWVIRWKEYTDGGTVRGRGQFYERPYAWIED